MTQSNNDSTQRRFLQSTFCAAVAILLFGCSTLPHIATGDHSTDEKRPPNIILIFADDLGYGDLGCFGSERIRTPRLDRMAEEGMKFTDFYSACAVCSPSRAALMTGRYPLRTGITRVLSPFADRNVMKGGVAGIPESEITIADLLKAQGYATACIGKWHLGHEAPHLPTYNGFDYYYGLPYSNDMSVQPKGQPKGVPLMRNEEILEQPVVQETLTQRYTEESIAFIEQNRDRPFFLYLPHTFPHTPLFASERFAGRSPHGIYADTVEELDWSCGEIFDTLKKLGIDHNTLVIFTSDNGPAGWADGRNGSAGPLRGGKASQWEGGFRVPCIMRWPDAIPAGKTCSEMTATIDMLPTLARIGGAETPADRIVDGKDIAPLMFGAPGARTPHDAYFYYWVDEIKAVRSGKWKLLLAHKEVRGKRGKKSDRTTVELPDTLYDLEADLGETTDVSAQHPEQMKRLRDLIERQEATEPATPKLVRGR